MTHLDAYAAQDGQPADPDHGRVGILSRVRRTMVPEAAQDPDSRALNTNVGRNQYVYSAQNPQYAHLGYPWSKLRLPKVQLAATEDTNRPVVARRYPSTGPAPATQHAYRDRVSGNSIR